MRISDWSSDVCSSDLDLQAQARAKVRTVLPQLADGTDPLPAIRAQLSGLQAGDRFGHTVGALLSAVASAGGAELDALGYADRGVQATLVVDAPATLEDRKSVRWGKRVSVRLGLGGRG